MFRFQREVVGREKILSCNTFVFTSVIFSSFLQEIRDIIENLKKEQSKREEQYKQREQEQIAEAKKEQRAAKQEKQRLLFEYQCKLEEAERKRQISTSYSVECYDIGRQMVAEEVKVREDPNITTELVVGGIGIAVGAAGLATAVLLASPAAPIVGIGAAVLGGTTALVSLGKALFK